MKVLETNEGSMLVRYGRLASATVGASRRSGYLLGNKFLFSDDGRLLWVECEPGEFKAVKIWRK
ncbi:MAG: hypothetical protein H7A09_08940 [Oceanospirillaceae bacterium]|nr:hypothetical protein [Oceanospirillaceae bacterium]MCP5335306.1 hypothetical protein [Oceanospirillaceae bacterium]MCP5350741.1 hypothetical protein [Oceanospirillaceae bacterium]